MAPVFLVAGVGGVLRGSLCAVLNASYAVLSVLPACAIGDHGK